MLYALFLIEAYGLGFLWNAYLFMQNQLVPFKLQAISYEINISVGSVFSMICPLIAKLDEPIPSIVLSAMVVVVLFSIQRVQLPSK